MAKTKTKRASAAKKPKKSLSMAWDFHLYVAGSKPRSVAAFKNLQKLCDEHFPGHYRITVTDLRRNPEAARTADIAALPTLIRRLPEPMRRIIGDLSRTDEVLLALKKGS